MFRATNFFVSSSLSTPLEMPNFKKWRVCDGDRDVEGSLLVTIRSKGWFFDRVYSPGTRHCVLTRRGFLLIYAKETRGFVLDMHSCKKTRTKTDAVSISGKRVRRCFVKLRFPFGAVSVVLVDGKIEEWREGLLKAVEAPRTAALASLHLPSSTPPPLATPLKPPPISPSRPKVSSNRQVRMRPPPRKFVSSSQSSARDGAPLTPVLRIRPVALIPRSPFSMYGIFDSEEDRALAEIFRTETPLEITEVDTSTCDPDYQWLSSSLSAPRRLALPSIEEENHIEPSHSTSIPVSWMKRQLEGRVQSSRRLPVAVRAPSIKEIFIKTTEPSLQTVSTFDAQSSPESVRGDAGRMQILSDAETIMEMES